MKNIFMLLLCILGLSVLIAGNAMCADDGFTCMQKCVGPALKTNNKTFLISTLDSCVKQCSSAVNSKDRWEAIACSNECSKKQKEYREAGKGVFDLIGCLNACGFK